MKIFTLSCSDTLFFNDRINTNQHLISIIDTLDIQDNISFPGPKFISLNDLINFHEQVTIRSNKILISLYDTLTFNQLISYDPLGILTTYKLAHSLTFTQILIAQPTKGTFDFISFIDTVKANIVKPIILLDSLTFNQHASIYVLSINKNITIDRIYTDPLIVNPRSEITFRQADGNVFGLFRLSFGNQYITKYNHIQRETLGRSLILAGNDTYPYRQSVKSVKYKFEYLKEQEANSFLAFLNNNLGLPIQVQDYEGIIFNGFISTPEVEVVQNDRNNRSIEFEIEIIPGP